MSHREHTTVLGCRLTLHSHIEPETRRVLMLRMDDGRTAEVVLSAEDRVWLRQALTEELDLPTPNPTRHPDVLRVVIAHLRGPDVRGGVRFRTSDGEFHEVRVDEIPGPFPPGDRALSLDSLALLADAVMVEWPFAYPPDVTLTVTASTEPVAESGGMTGPEHYREAERLISVGEDVVREIRAVITNEARRDALGKQAVGIWAQAQVHATLAQVAATMDLVGATVNGQVSTGWGKVL